MGTPNWEPQEYSRNIMEYQDPGRYIHIIFLLYSWGSLFGVPILVPLLSHQGASAQSSLTQDLRECRFQGLEFEGLGFSNSGLRV